VSSKASEQIRSAKRRGWRKGVSVCYRFVSLIGPRSVHPVAVMLATNDYITGQTGEDGLARSQIESRSYHPITQRYPILNVKFEDLRQ